MAWFPNLQNLGSSVNICNLWMLIKQDVIRLAKIVRTNVTMCFSFWVSEANFCISFYLCLCLYLCLSVFLSLSLSLFHTRTHTRTQFLKKKNQRLIRGMWIPWASGLFSYKKKTQKEGCVPRAMSDFFFFVSSVPPYESKYTDILIYCNIYLFKKAYTLIKIELMG